MNIAGHWPVGGLVALALIAFSTRAVRAQDAQTGACFSIITGNSERPDAGAFLLNRCSGQSWILVRAHQTRGGPGYRWSPIAGPFDQPTVPVESTAPKSRPVESTATKSSKCFTFQNRRFCE
jgi:hypothetical protein